MTSDYLTGREPTEEQAETMTPEELSDAWASVQGEAWRKCEEADGEDYQRWQDVMTAAQTKVFSVLHTLEHVTHEILRQAVEAEHGSDAEVDISVAAAMGASRRDLILSGRRAKVRMIWTLTHDTVFFDEEGAPCFFPTEVSRSRGLRPLARRLYLLASTGSNLTEEEKEQPTWGETNVFDASLARRFSF